MCTQTRENREIDFLVCHMLNCTNICELCMLMLNLKKATHPKNPKLPLILHYGFTIYNLRQELCNERIRGKGPYNGISEPFFTQSSKIELPEYLMEPFTISNNKPVYKEFCRNTIFTRPSPRKNTIGSILYGIRLSREPAG